MPVQQRDPPATLIDQMFGRQVTGPLLVHVDAVAGVDRFIDHPGDARFSLQISQDSG